MKHWMKLSLAIMLLVLVCFAAGDTAQAASLVGTTGSVSYALDTSTYILTLSGSGATANYTTSSRPPWDFYPLYGVVVEEGVTDLGSYLFYGETQINSVTLPSTLKTIGNACFNNCGLTCTIYLPDGITNVGGNYEAFWGNPQVNVVASGTSGEVNWQLRNRTFTVYGNGRMDDYTSYGRPWRGLMAGAIDKIVVEDGVTHVGAYTFSYSSSYYTTVTSVTLGSSVTSVGAHFADNLLNLANVTIKGPLTTVGTEAFAGCKNLTSLTLYNGVEEIGICMFSGAYQLSSLTLPSTVKRIGDYAFQSCNAIKAVTLPEGLERLGAYAFRNTGITSVTLPSGIQETGHDPFPYGCEVIRDSVFTTGDLTWTIEDEVLKITGSGYIPDYATSGPWTAFEDEIVSVELGSGVTRIGNRAFKGMYIDSISIPSTVTSIGEYAFSGCSLSEVDIPGSVKSIGDYAFDGCSNLVSVTMHEGTEVLGDHAFYSSKLKVLHVPSTVKTIGYNMVYAHNMTDVSGYWLKGHFNSNTMMYEMNGGTLTITGSGDMPTFDHEVESRYNIDDVDSPWYDMRELITRVVIGEGITSVGYASFYRCINLTDVSLPSTLTSISYEAFKKTALKSITVPDSVTYIGSDAFSGTNLTHFTFPRSMTEISGLYGCGKLTSVTLPPVVTAIGTSCFSGTAITEFTIPDTVTSIAGSAFANTKITSMVIPDSVTTIGTYVFSGCTLLTDITFPKHITALPSGTFSSCEALTDYVVPEHITSIGSYAFYGADGLKSVTFHDGVQSINSCAFYDSAVSKLVFEGTAPSTIAGDAFKYVRATAIYEPGPSWSGKLLSYGGTLITWTKVNGAAGDGVGWRKEDENTISLKGAGVATTPDWARYVSGVTTLTVSADVLGIDNTVLASLPYATRVVFQGSAPAITEAAFAGKTLDVYYPHSDPAWAETVKATYGGSVKYHMYCPTAGVDTQLTLIPVAEVPAQCTTDGTKAHYLCGGCQAPHTDPTLLESATAEMLLIPATGHAYGEASFLWAEDGSAVTVTFDCAAGDDTQTFTPEVTAETESEPNCVDPGVTRYTAQVEFNEQTWTDSVSLADVPALGHEEVEIENWPPTCTEPGLSNDVFCIVCGETLAMAEEIPPLGHTEVVTLEHLDPTCAEDGHTEEISCEVCSEVITASEIIPATGEHTEYVSAEAVAPTCTEEGSTAEISCEVCSAVLTPSEPVAPTGHDYLEPVFNWAEDGSYCEAAFTCSVGDNVMTVPATVHGEPADAPTCTEEGSTCYVAHVDFEDQAWTNSITLTDVPALGHDPVTAEAVAPTNRLPGLTEGSHCGRCGEVLTAQEEVPSIFTYDGDTIIAYNGTDADVVIPDDATALGATVFKDNTSINSIRVPANVTAVGAQTFSGCSAKDIWLPDNMTGILASTFYKVTGHIHAELNSPTAILMSLKSVPLYHEGYFLRYRVTSATATPSGMFILGYDGGETDVVIPADFGGVTVTQISTNAFANHTELTSVTVPDGVTTIAGTAFTGCSSDLVLISGYKSPARTFAANNGFKWQHAQHTVEVIPGTPAGCNTTGVSDGAKCSECGEVLTAQEEVPALGHEPVVDEAVAPTCTDTGLTEGSHCDRCDEVLTAQEEVPALGHEPAEEWSSDEAGHWHVCATCGDLADDVLPHVNANHDRFCDDCLWELHPAFSAAFVLPAGVTHIEEEAFADLTVEAIGLPEGVESIGRRAFAGNTALRMISLPATVTYISIDAFEGCSEELVIYGPENVMFMEYAEDRGFTYVIH